MAAYNKLKRGAIMTKILAMILAGAVVFAVIFGIMAVINGIDYLLQSPTMTEETRTTIIIIISLLAIVGANVLAFFQSYKWESRKPWYFPLCLVLSFVFLIMMLGGLGQ